MIPRMLLLLAWLSSGNRWQHHAFVLKLRNLKLVDSTCRSANKVYILRLASVHPMNCGKSNYNIRLCQCTLIYAHIQNNFAIIADGKVFRGALAHA